MKILAFDTSLTGCSAAIFDSDKTPAMTSLFKDAPMQQAQMILAMIKELLEAASLSFAELDVVAYAAGPGSFTGVRIASSVVQAISYSAALPVIRISSLAVLAQTMYAQSNCKNILVAVDARVEQIYWAVYKINELGFAELHNEERVCFPHEIILDDDQSYCGVGDGWQNYGAILADRLGKKFPSVLATTLLPRADALAQLAQREYESRNVVDFTQALPIYLR